MKTKFILGSLLVSSMAIGQQNTFPSPGPGNAGIGTLSPAYKLDIFTSTNNDGIRIVEKSSGLGACGVYLDNQTTGGNNWSMLSLGNGDTPGAGYYTIFQNTSPSTGYRRFLIDGTTGNIGIGSDNPAHKLEVISGLANDGIKVIQTTGHAAAFHLDNQTTNGQHWALFSTGAGNTQGAGHFSIYDYNSNTDRLFIDGPSGNVGIGTISPSYGRLVVNHDGQPSYNRAIYATALKTTGTSYWNAGVEGRGGFMSECGLEAYGVIGRAYNGNVSIGGDFYAYTTICDGYRSASGNNNISIGVYGSADTYGAYFNGNLEHTGTLTEPADMKLNDNVKPLQNAMDKINLLKPRTYTCKIDEFKDMKLPEGQQMGLIAQELAEVFPELVKSTGAIVHKDEKGEITSSIPEHKSVNYMSLIPLLIAGMQEQQQIIATQQKQLDEQERTINTLIQKSGTTTGIQNNSGVEVGFQMSQNEPNPFTHETTVKYTMPQNVSNAFMAVYDLSGKQITTFPIDQRGSSTVTITSEKLAAGIYIYSIVADGKIIDSKRMVVSEK